jgi:hypothetical protein
MNFFVVVSILEALLGALFSLFAATYSWRIGQIIGFFSEWKIISVAMLIFMVAEIYLVITIDSFGASLNYVIYRGLIALGIILIWRFKYGLLKKLKEQRERDGLHPY